MAVGAAAGSHFSTDQLFYLRAAIALVLVTLVGFATNFAHGYADPANLPWWVHVHALAMVAWLVLFVVQNWLAYRGNFQSHRAVGRAGAGLALAIVLLGPLTAIRVLTFHRIPPEMDPAPFLAFTLGEIALFAGMVGRASSCEATCSGTGG